MGVYKKIISLYAADNHWQQILKKGAGSIIVKMVSTLLTFILAVFLGRVLGPDGYGIYSFTISILLLLAIPIQAGLPHLIVREVSKLKEAKNWSTLKGLLRWRTYLIISYSFVVIVLLLVLVKFDLVKYGEVDALIAGALLIPGGALLATQGASLRGLGLVVIGQVPNNIVRHGILILFVSTIIWFFPIEGLSAEHIIVLQVISTLLAFFIGSYILSKLIKKRGMGSAVSIMNQSTWFRTVYPLSLLAGFQVINSYADVLVLGFFRTNEEVGIYRIVAQTVGLITFGLFAINQVMHPQFAKMFASGEFKKLQRLVTSGTRMIFLVAIPPALVFLFWGEGVLGLLFGVEYKIGSIALSILVVGQLVNAAFGSVGALLNMTGHEKDTVKGVMIAALLNVFLNILLVPELGMTGAAISTSCSMIVWNVILRSFVKKRLNIETLGW